MCLRVLSSEPAVNTLVNLEGEKVDRTKSSLFTSFFFSLSLAGKQSLHEFFFASKMKQKYWTCSERFSRVEFASEISVSWHFCDKHSRVFSAVYITVTVAPGSRKQFWRSLPTTSSSLAVSESRDFHGNRRFSHTFSFLLNCCISLW